MVPNQAVQMVKLHCRLNPIKLRSVYAGTEPDTERSGTVQSKAAAVCVHASEGDNHMYWALHANGGVFMRTQFFFRLCHLAHPASNSEHRNCSRCRAGGCDDDRSGGGGGRQDVGRIRCTVRLERFAC